jgi:hypothetical protein
MSQHTARSLRRAEQQMPDEDLANARPLLKPLDFKPSLCGSRTSIRDDDTVSVACDSPSKATPSHFVRDPAAAHCRRTRHAWLDKRGRPSHRALSHPVVADQLQILQPEEPEAATEGARDRAGCAISARRRARP